MRRVENSSAWLVLALAGWLGGCATPAPTATPESGDGERASVEVSDEETSDTAGLAVEVKTPAGRSPLAELAAARGEIDEVLGDIRMAEARGMPQAEARSWLEQAQAAVDAGDAGKARKLAAEAGAQVRAALAGYYTDMAQQRIEVLRRDYAGKMSAIQRMRLDNAESALRAGKGEVALMLVEKLVAEVAPDAVFESHRTTDGKLTRIIVHEGDTLSSIAARPEVYGNADLWPLLLKANRDKFLRVDEVPVGIELVIPRNVPQAEIEQALAQAR